MFTSNFPWRKYPSLPSCKPTNHGALHTSFICCFVTHVINKLYTSSFFFVNTPQSLPLSFFCECLVKELHCGDEECVYHLCGLFPNWSFLSQISSINLATVQRYLRAAYVIYGWLTQAPFFSERSLSHHRQLSRAPLAKYGYYFLFSLIVHL